MKLTPKKENVINEYQKGGKLKPKKSKLVKNAEKLNGNKRDMRKKMVKSNTKESDLKRPIKKHQMGGRLFSTYNSIQPYEEPVFNVLEVPQEVVENRLYKNREKVLELASEKRQEKLNDPKINTDEPLPVDKTPSTKPIVNAVDYSRYKGYDQFNKFYDEVEKTNPEASKYRRFLTQMAQQESGFDSYIQNQMGAPAYGYFQFMDFNITPTGMTIDEFRNNPTAQINSAIKLAKQFESSFNQEDLKLAEGKGYSINGLLGGAWLAGAGGVRKYLQGQGNPSDRHWDKSGKNRGTDVESRIKAFNYQQGGIFNWSWDEYGKNRNVEWWKPVQEEPKSYRPSPDIIKFIKDKEGFKSKIYKDGKGVETIGYGFTDKSIINKYRNKSMTKAEADILFNQEIEDRLDLIQQTPNFDQLNQNQRDALFSLLYNVGQGNYFNKSPNLQKGLTDLDHDTVVKNMDHGMNDKRNRGLRQRRLEEQEWYNKQEE